MREYIYTVFAMGNYKTRLHYRKKEKLSDGFIQSFLMIFPTGKKRLLGFFNEKFPNK